MTRLLAAAAVAAAAAVVLRRLDDVASQLDALAHQIDDGIRLRVRVAPTQPQEN